MGYEEANTSFLANAVWRPTETSGQFYELWHINSGANYPLSFSI